MAGFKLRGNGLRHYAVIERPFVHEAGDDGMGSTEADEDEH